MDERGSVIGDSGGRGGWEIGVEDPALCQDWSSMAEDNGVVVGEVGGMVICL